MSRRTGLRGKAQRAANRRFIPKKQARDKNKKHRTDRHFIRYEQDGV